MNLPFLRLAIVLWLLGFAFDSRQTARAAEPAASRPNILFVFADDHATSAVSAYGSKINRTPNIDRLAREGMRFDNCFCTNSICGPSRAVILTGKHSHLNGMRKNETDKFDGSQQTFPKLMQKAGYQTAIVGKWHLVSEPTGFDHWMILPGQGVYYNPDFLTPIGRVRKEGYVTDIITDEVLGWLQNKRDASKPFVMMYQHKAPHRDWCPGPEQLALYRGEKIPEPPTLFDDYANRSKAARMQTMSIAKNLNLCGDLKVPPEIAAGYDNAAPNAWRNRNNRMSEKQRQQWEEAYAAEHAAFAKEQPKGDDLVRWKYQRYIKDYLRVIASVDENLGRVLDYLDKSGLAKNTVVIYSSDQGFFLGEHGWFDKRFMYEESLRMPFVVRWPEHVRPGSTDTHLVQNLDFAQTFLDLAGIEAPADMQGSSLAPLFKGESPADWRKSIYYHFYESDGPHTVPKHYGVRNERYKLIHFYEIDEWELFDLKEDPQEMRNVYGQESYKTVVEEMKEELTRLRKQYDDNGG
jgi:arylsulfatase A-like enzyme